jgi:hypothetical protein
MPQHDNHEYRFAAIDKKLDKLDHVHEIVTRLDERFNKIDEVYDTRTSALEKRTDTHDKDLDDLKTFKWKAVGIVSVVMVVISVFGSAIGNAIVRKVVAPLPARENVSLDETNSSGYYQAKDGTKGSSQLIQTPSVTNPKFTAPKVSGKSR